MFPHTGLHMLDLLEDWIAMWVITMWVWMDPHAPIEEDE
jgi:hypothetical protein